MNNRLIVFIILSISLCFCSSASARTSTYSPPSPVKSVDGIAQTNKDLSVGGDLTVQGVSYFGDKVGIGKDTPAVKLDVVGAIQSSSYISANSTVIFNGAVYDYNGNGGFFAEDNVFIVTDYAGNDTISKIVFAKDTNTTSIPSSENTLMVIEQDGNVGIGTASPAAQLEIEGTDSPRDLLGVNSLTTDDVLVVTENGDMAVNTDDLYVDISSGNVGIGVFPEFALHTRRSGANYTVFETTSDTNTNFWLKSNGIYKAQFTYRAEDDALKISHRETGVSTSNVDLVIKNGDVGINTATPDAQLAVIGDINISNNLSTSGASNDTAPTGTSKYIEVYINGVLYEIEAKLPS